jgi:hypothetical protein
MNGSRPAGRDLAWPEQLDPGQLAKIQPFWPGNEQIPAIPAG